MVTQKPWRAISLDSPLQRTPDVPTPAPVQGKINHLPLDLLSWEDFERIQWRVLRDIEGLRYAQIYGDRGQIQYGLDVVALAPNSDGVALQSKRYKKFGPAELGAAVNKFRTTTRPFSVARLIIGVSREVKSTKVVERLAQLRKDLHPIQLDLWDKQEISRLLRESPEIVIEFFGLPTAESFCLPFESTPVTIPTVDAVAVKEALARTPEETTGAATLLAQAESFSNEPKRSLSHVEEAQERLRAAGFHGHAAQYEPRRTRLLAELGRADEAARQIMEEFWSALDQGLTTTAQSAQHRVHQLVEEVEPISPVSEIIDVVDSALDLYLNPLGYVPDMDSLAIGAPMDRVRLAILAGETALANDDQVWLKSSEPSLELMVDAANGDKLAQTRLRLLLAEATNDWAELLADARKLRLGHGLLSLVTARYARNCAMRQQFEEADALWNEAAGDACLAQDWSDAATWIFSRRAFRARWKPFTSDEMLPMQTALRHMGPSPHVVPIDGDAHVDALEARYAGRLRSAAISAQRALRDAVVLGDWVAEGQTRRLMAAICTDADEPEIAARHLVRAGDTKTIKGLGETYSAHFIDITPELSAPNYWMVGTAYRLIAEQADLVPDDLMEHISDSIVADLSKAEAGTLVDLRAFATSRYLGAVSALAGIAHRLTLERATMVCAHFERQPPVEPHHSRHHDADEAIAVARIANAHTSLRQRAIEHLIPLLARSQTARKSAPVEVVNRYIGLARDHLRKQAKEGNTWAQEVMALHDPAETPAAVVEAALSRLTTPLKHREGVFTLGTEAVRDSLLVRGLPSALLEAAVAEQLRRASDPHVGSADRCDYLIAAANLAADLDDEVRTGHFTGALHCATSTVPSKHDELDQRFSHKLGVMRVENSNLDSRDRAVFLAACLSTTVAQRAEVRTQAYALLSGNGQSDYWVTRAIQQLGESLKEDLGFLVGQGWALRSLAAILWTMHGGPAQVGARLAEDRDVRVRRAFAKALAEVSEEDFQAPVRVRLGQDPCYSVRTALIGDDAP